MRLDAGSYDVWCGLRERSALHPLLRRRLETYDAMLALFDALDQHRPEISRILASKR